MSGSGNRRSRVSVIGRTGSVAAGSAPVANPIRVLSLDQLARKYDFTPPDEYVGTDSRFFLDYGPPVVLADSSQRSSGEEDEQKVWRDTLKFWRDR